MGERTLIATGVVGAALAMICCATPLLAVVFGAAGLTAWLSKTDYIVIPALLICLALVGIGLYRRRMTTQACRDPGSSKRSVKS